MLILLYMITINKKPAVKKLSIMYINNQISITN